MAKMTTDDLLDVFKEMTILELSELKKAFEEEFDVTAAAPAAVIAMGPAEAGAAEEEQTEFDVVLTAIGSAKIQVIKVVRELTSLGLKEAKAVVDDAPGPVLEAVDNDAAAAAKAKLEEVGASVDIK